MIPETVSGNTKGYLAKVTDSNKRCKVYLDEELKDSNNKEYVDVLSDQIYIISISSSCDSALISYPVGNGKKRKERWISTYYLTGCNSTFTEIRAAEKCNTYYLPKADYTYGYISPNDRVWVYYDSLQDQFVRVIYELDKGGYKFAWVELDQLVSKPTGAPETNAITSTREFEIAKPVSIDKLLSDIQNIERSAVGYGKYVSGGTEGYQYFTGNLIMKIEVLSWQIFKQTVNVGAGAGDAYNKKIVTIRVPKKIMYYLHSHSYGPKITSQSVGNALVGLASWKICTTMTCDCGESYVYVWEIPEPSDSKDYDHYVVSPYSQYP